MFLILFTFNVRWMVNVLFFVGNNKNYSEPLVMPTWRNASALFVQRECENICATCLNVQPRKPPLKVYKVGDMNMYSGNRFNSRIPDGKKACVETSFLR